MTMPTIKHVRAFTLRGGGAKKNRAACRLTDLRFQRFYLRRLLGGKFILRPYYIPVFYFFKPPLHSPPPE